MDYQTNVFLKLLENDSNFIQILKNIMNIIIAIIVMLHKKHLNQIILLK